VRQPTGGKAPTSHPRRHFGDGKGSYKGMTNDEAMGWMNLGLMSGMLYRNQLLPNLQKMLDAGRPLEARHRQAGLHADHESARGLSGGATPFTRFVASSRFAGCGVLAPALG
jgi:hypothetical protein